MDEGHAAHAAWIQVAPAGGDGRRQARAWCSLAREDGTIVPAVPVWFDESDAALARQLTHWRPAASGTTRGSAFTVE